MLWAARIRDPLLARPAERAPGCAACARRGRRGDDRGHARHRAADRQSPSRRSPIASLPANLLALPAVAPVMWLGMLAAIAGQMPGLPGAATHLRSRALLAAYVAQVAHWLGAPGWAQLEIGAPARRRSWLRTRRSACARGRALGWARRRRGLCVAGRVTRWPPPRWPRPSWRSPSGCPTAARAPRRARRPACASSCSTLARATRSCSIRPTASPLLVDGGPPGDELRDQLEREGVAKLAAAVVTHDQSDHVGGIEELLGILSGRPAPLRASAAPTSSGDARARTFGRGRSRRVGGRLGRPAPPGAVAAPSGARPAARRRIRTRRRSCCWRDWHRFSMLLTADAEAEAVPIDPGPVDVLKVAHHGSDDAGLGALLDRTAPRLAVISVGATTLTATRPRRRFPPSRSTVSGPCVRTRRAT